MEYPRGPERERKEQCTVLWSEFISARNKKHTAAIGERINLGKLKVYPPPPTNHVGMLHLNSHNVFQKKKQLFSVSLSLSHSLNLLLTRILTKFCGRTPNRSSGYAQWDLSIYLGMFFIWTGETPCFTHTHTQYLSTICFWKKPPISKGVWQVVLKFMNCKPKPPT